MRGEHRWERIEDFSNVKKGDVVRLWSETDEAFVADAHGFTCWLVLNIEPAADEPKTYRTTFGAIPFMSGAIH